MDLEVERSVDVDRAKVAQHLVAVVIVFRPLLLLLMLLLLLLLMVMVHLQDVPLISASTVAITID